MPPPSSAADGILVVDKPSGPTSHDVVARARRIYGTRRVGHGGTLDPMATGVLVLLFGEATKLSDVVTRGNKSYRAEICLGRGTDSHDADGATTQIAERLPELSAAAIEAALAGERARTLQVPPAVSAVKVDGRRAYRSARAGHPPELAPRPVVVHRLQLLDHSGPVLSVELTVSKGYYVRALARDIGAALGVPAHLTQLRRLQSGCFSASEAISWPPVAKPSLLDLSAALPRLIHTLRLTERGVQRARRGQILQDNDFVDAPARNEHEPEALCAWTNIDGTPIALGHACAEGYRVQRGFVP